MLFLSEAQICVPQLASCPPSFVELRCEWSSPPHLVLLISSHLCSGYDTASPRLRWFHRADATALECYMTL